MSFQHHPDVMLELSRDRTERLKQEIERQRLLSGLPQSPSLWDRLLALSGLLRKREQCPPIPPVLPATMAS
jgi:hypothetical protein